MRSVTLIDGRQVLSDSEEWRHECEARSVLRMPTLQARRERLDGIEQKRGKAAVDALKATMEIIWEARKK